MSARKRIAIVQSNYVPWRGYFDLISSVDEFVLLDDAQYTRRDWRNRNRIKTAQGLRWLTVPVEVSGRYTQAIRETKIADEGWAEAHWQTLRHAYGQAPCFEMVRNFMEDLYARAPGPYLTHINRYFLTEICAWLGVGTPLKLSMDYQPCGTKSERLVDICIKAGATDYVSGPAAKVYLDEDLFRSAGIAVSWFEYGPYREYQQVYPPFEPMVSIVDLLFSVGSEAGRYIHSARSLDPVL